MYDVGRHTRVGRVADHDTCVWASTIFRALWFNMGEKEGYTISKGNMILRDLAELCLVDQRCQTGLKLILCGKASATQFCQYLLCDFRYQALSGFYILQVKRGLGTRPVLSHYQVIRVFPRPVQHSGPPCLEH